MRQRLPLRRVTARKDHVTQHTSQVSGCYEMLRLKRSSQSSQKTNSANWTLAQSAFCRNLAASVFPTCSITSRRKRMARSYSISQNSRVSRLQQFRRFARTRQAERVTVSESRFYGLRSNWRTKRAPFSFSGNTANCSLRSESTPQERTWLE